MSYYLILITKIYTKILNFSLVPIVFYDNSQRTYLSLVFLQSIYVNKVKLWQSIQPSKKIKSIQCRILHGITPFGKWRMFGETKSLLLFRKITHWYLLFIQNIINKPKISMNNFVRYYPHWTIADPWDNTTKSSPLSFIHSNGYQCIKNINAFFKRG